MTRIRSRALPLLALLALPGVAAAAEEVLKPFEVVQFAPTAWYGRFGKTNCSWVDAGSGVLLVDAGGTEADTKNVLAEVKRTTNKPVKWVVLTHLHVDSNGGLPTLFPSDVTVFANERTATPLAEMLEAKAAGGKHATIVGIQGRTTVRFGVLPVELLVPRASAHSDYDLVAYVPEVGAAFVGDLVTPGRCPMMSDAGCDPHGWQSILDSVMKLHPTLIVPTRGNAAVSGGGIGLDLDKEVARTRSYIDRMLAVLVKIQKEKGAESRVSSELRLNKINPEYCPVELDAINGVALYKRMTPSGDFRPSPDMVAAAAALGTAKAPAPAKKK